MEKKRLTVRLDTEIHSRLMQLKENCFPYLSLNSLIEIALRNFLHDAHDCIIKVRRKRNGKK